MGKYGLLIDYDWCTGCHACEVACQMEHQLPVGQFGIKVSEVGPWQYGDDQWQISYIPLPTDQCNLCSERVAYGKLPTCAHHCQANCIEYGDLESLAKKLSNHNKQVLFAI